MRGFRIRARVSVCPSRCVNVRRAFFRTVWGAGDNQRYVSRATPSVAVRRPGGGEFRYAKTHSLIEPAGPPHDRLRREYLSLGCVAGGSRPRDLEENRSQTADIKCDILSIIIQCPELVATDLTK